MTLSQFVGRTVESLLTNNTIHTATTYISEDTTVRATRKRYLKKRNIDLRAKSVDIILTIGKPNHAARKFIKICKKAKVSFPIKAVQIKFFPRKRGK